MTQIWQRKTLAEFVETMNTEATQQLVRISLVHNSVKSSKCELNLAYSGTRLVSELTPSRLTRFQHARPKPLPLCLGLK